jgi:iron complex transport system substrate-binding protein
LAAADGLPEAPACCDAALVNVWPQMRAWMAALALAAGSACAKQAAAPPDGVAAGCVERFDPAADYFPVKATVEAAELFSVSYHGH